MMPWTLKFLWSPFLEMFKTKKIFRGTDADGYRGRLCSGSFGVAVAGILCGVHCTAGGDCLQWSHTRCGYGRCLHVGTEQAGPGQVHRLAGSLLQYSEDCSVRWTGLVGRCFVGRLRWSGGCHRGSPLRSYPACMDDGDADIGGGDAAAWLLSHTHVAVGRCGRIRCQSRQGRRGSSWWR